MTMHWALAGALGHLSPLLLGLFLALGTCRARAGKCIPFPAHGVLNPCSPVHTDSSLRQSNYIVVILPALALMDRDEEGGLWLPVAGFYGSTSSMHIRLSPQALSPPVLPHYLLQLSTSVPKHLSSQQVPLSPLGVHIPVLWEVTAQAKGGFVPSPSSHARGAGASVPNRHG